VKRSLIVFVALAAAASLATGASSFVGATAKVSTGNSSLGRILVDGKGRTLYLFEKDPRRHSACSGTCATYWPPLLTHGEPTAGHGVRASLLGAIRRADGTTQVTYAGHPLYRYLEDTKPGQTRGQDSHIFGAGWYVLSPAGKKIDAEQSGKNLPEVTQPYPPRYDAR
jgi:predicted lipoprotein with Yx(FWY)xxD motif